jgi:hypothetical protein
LFSTDRWLLARAATTPGRCSLRRIIDCARRGQAGNATTNALHRNSARAALTVRCYFASADQLIKPRGADTEQQTCLSRTYGKRFKIVGTLATGDSWMNDHRHELLRAKELSEP